MFKAYKENLRTLLARGEFEDPEGELNLALYHLETSRFPKAEFSRLVKGLEQNIPVPRIISYTFICGVPITITPYVLCPGPETVTLIEEAIKYINSTNVATALDLCTGSGSISVVIAKKCKVNVTATDISKSSLKIAKINALINKVRVEFLQGDLFRPVEGRIFDVIITNPPYIKTDEIATLPHFIRDFTPKIAIDGGCDGLFFHRLILSQAQRFLHKQQYLFLECGDYQDREVLDLCRQYDWRIEQKYPNKHGKIRGFKLVPCNSIHRASKK